MKTFLLCCAIALCACVSAASAQTNTTFPARPVRWIVPFTPGGAADISSRVIGQKLAEAWGQQIVIDNRPGAAGNLGIELVARANPDGYTVVLVPATFTTHTHLTAKPLYDPLRDFAAITLVSFSPLVLVVHPSVPAKNVQELIAFAKSKPKLLNYASSGTGASAHMAAELFKTATKTDIVHVPYKAQPPALLDVMSGRVHMMFPNLPSAISHIKSGKLRALAVTSERRSTLFPELPTFPESGLPGFEVTQWGGLVAPARTPPAITAKFQQAVSAALKLPDVKTSLENQGFEAVGNTPAEFTTFLRNETAKWGRVIKEAGIQAD